MLNNTQQSEYQLKASKFLSELPDQVANAVLDNTEGGLLRMSAESILLVAVYTNMEPWDIITKHGFGIMKQWYVDELEELCQRFNGSTLSTVHLSAA